ncbi:MAG: response regulator transcription factor [Bryobacterales bacterium]|nr:response regulator transcription factor [Bryobacterales bacterium]
MRVLIIDDDTDLCALLREFLEREGFQADFEHEGPAGLARALEEEHALVILDVMLPGIDGFEVLRRLRRKSRVPVLMLTARGDDVDRIVGLDLGADDYLPKPFNPRELAARMRAILRRVEMRKAAPAPLIEVDGVELDPSTREVRNQGRPVEVTTFEFDILETLMRAAGRVVSRDELMERLYNRKATPLDRSVDMHISHLRRKLESPGKTRIKTVRGAGYQFSRSPEEAAE